MSRSFKPMDALAEAAFAERLCARCPHQPNCTLLAEARLLDSFDPDFPAELVFDDDGRPACTAFAAPAAEAETAPASVPARPAPAVPAPALDVVSMEVTTVARGLVEAAKLRPGRRSFTVPYADVRELFGDGAAAVARDALGVPEPARARVHHGRLGVIVTARSKRDGASVSSTVRLKLAGGRR